MLPSRAGNCAVQTRSLWGREAHAFPVARCGARERSALDLRCRERDGTPRADLRVFMLFTYLFIIYYFF